MTQNDKEQYEKSIVRLQKDLEKVRKDNVILEARLDEARRCHACPPADYQINYEKDFASSLVLSPEDIPK